MLKDKVVLVTGGSRGIGKAVAIACAKEGAKVIVNYNGSYECAKQVAREIEENGGQNVMLQKADVSNFTEASQLIENTIKQYGRIDVVVNNAGITRDNLLLKMSEEDFDQVIATNLKGTFNVMKHVIKSMVKQRYGRIINIASVVGVTGNAGQVNYAASKAGIIGMTKSLAREVGTRGITINAIAPGYIETEMTEGLPDGVKEAVVNQIPLKKMGCVQDVSDAVVFLASDKAAYITGQTIHIDGGLAM